MILAISRAWDGEEAPSWEHALVTIAQLGSSLDVRVDAPLHGDPPPPSAPGPTWGLWEHEVVELFVAGGEHYTELEVGPHGHYLLLRLAGRRSVVERCALEVAVQQAGDRWTASCRLSGDVLPPRPWTVNAYAIHGVGAARRYLAWAPVPGPAPDFHRLECFRSISECGGPTPR